MKKPTKKVPPTKCIVGFTHSFIIDREPDAKLRPDPPSGYWFMATLLYDGQPKLPTGAPRYSFAYKTSKSPTLCLLLVDRETRQLEPAGARASHEFRAAVADAIFKMGGKGWFSIYGISGDATLHAFDDLEGKRTRAPKKEPRR